MIKVANLTKRYGKITALDNISFEVNRGEIVGFLGPNGAGKTTAMRILACFLPPTGGSVEIGGTDIFSESLEVRRKIGYLPESVPLYNDMRVVEYLKYRGRLKGVYGRKLRRRVDEVMSLCGLADESRRIIGHLSKGYKQRIGLADTLVHEPELLILDEPTIGLDPNQIRNIRNLIKNLAEKHTVLLSSHLLAEVDMVCSRVLIINKGKIIASDTPANLVGLMKGNIQAIAVLRADRKTVTEKVGQLPGVARVACEDEGEWLRVTCECAKDHDAREQIAALAAENKWPLRELRAEKKNLEDVFVALTTNGGAELEPEAQAPAEGGDKT